MTIDLRTVSITPLRHTFDHLVRRMGADKPVSRYIEGTMDVQPVENFHYRPTWGPRFEIFDPGHTAIRMRDWYALKDPRQYYYGAYTIARARTQENADADFQFVESRGLADECPPPLRETILDFYLPLRHVAYGGNLNNTAIGGKGYGTAFTQAAVYYAVDQLAIAQYLTRLGLTLGDEESLARGKRAWLDGAAWQPLRRLVEDLLVQEDVFELFLAQDLVLDGLLYPLAYEEADRALRREAGSAVSMMTRFQAEWFAESSKWVDAVAKAAVAESGDNRALIVRWTDEWRARALEALAPVAALALPDSSAEALARVSDAFDARAARLGLAS